MNDSRSSVGDGIWIGLCVLLVLLLALAGGFVWIQRQYAARAMVAAEMARAAEKENRLQAQLALAAAEQARSAAAQREAEEAQAQSTSTDDDASAPVQPAIPDLYLNQDLWRHVESLADAEPDAKVFTLDPQTGEIRFGDGEHGARPPNGAATIQAEYQTGGGGTVTVFLPAAELQQCRLRAVRFADGTLRLDVSDAKPDD